MADRIVIDPQLLMDQSAQMERIASSLQSLLDGVLGDLKNVSASWSEKLAGNFLGKITSAQQSFLGSVEMLHVSSASVKTAADTITEFESRWAERMGGSLGADTLKRVPLSLLLGKSIVEGYGALHDTLDPVNSALEEAYKKNVPSTVRALIDLGKDQATETAFGDMKFLPDVMEKLYNGDYAGAMEKLGDTGAKTVIQPVIEQALIAQGIPKPLAKIEAIQYVKYGLNVTKDTAEAATKVLLDPSLKNVMGFPWAVTVQPVLDTAGGNIEDVVKYIPGISEYYDSHECESISDMAKQALGDFYGSFTGDEDTREYYKHYYDDCDSPYEKIYDGIMDAVDFVGESGGPIHAARRFFKTGIGDAGDAYRSLSEVFSQIEKNGGFVSSVQESVSEMFTEKYGDLWDEIRVRETY